MTDAEKRIIDIVYGKDKEAKVLKNLKIGKVNAISKFWFEVKLTDEGDIDRYDTYFKLTENDMFDITSDTFLNNKEWVKYLRSKRSEVEAKAKAKAKADAEEKERIRDKGFGIWYADGTIQPYKKNHTAIKDVNKFKVYVTDDDYFIANLPSLDITNTSSLYYEKNSYLTAIIAAYVSTYVCGISTKHLEYNKETPGIITSMVRYHLY